VTERRLNKRTDARVESCGEGRRASRFTYGPEEGSARGTGRGRKKEGRRGEEATHMIQAQSLPYQVVGTLALASSSSAIASERKGRESQKKVKGVRGYGALGGSGDRGRIRGRRQKRRDAPSSLRPVKKSMVSRRTNLVRLKNFQKTYSTMKMLQ
jgi:hypothetical protein